MEKRSFLPVRRMKGLEKASVAIVKFLTLPKMIESEFETGYGPNKKTKWQMTVDVIKHPNGSKGEMVWQTTAQVIRIQIYNLVLEALEKKFDLGELLKDLQLNKWEIICDDDGLIGIKEV